MTFNEWLHVQAFSGDAKVISTGGLAPVFDGSTSVIDQVVPDITARGLIEIFKRSKKKA